MIKILQRPIKAEIQGDYLILEGKKINLEAIHNLVDFNETESQAESIDELIFSLARIGLHTAAYCDIEGDVKEVLYMLPDQYSIIVAKNISDALKFMEL